MHLNLFLNNNPFYDSHKQNDASEIVHLKVIGNRQGCWKYSLFTIRKTTFFE